MFGRNIVLLISLFVLSATAHAGSPSSRGFKAEQLLEVFSKDVAQHSRAISQVPLSDLKAGDRDFSFNYRNVSFHVEVLKGKNHLVRLNGKLFTAEEIKTPARARMAIVKKFGLSHKRWSLLSLFISSALAQTVINPLDSMGTMGSSAGMMQRQFYSYNFLGAGMTQTRFTSLAALQQYLDENSAEDALGVASSLLAAIYDFSLNDPTLNRMMDLGVPINETPPAPQFNSSWRTRTDT